MTLKDFKELPADTWIYTKRNYGFSLFKTTFNHVQTDRNGKVVCTLFINLSLAKRSNFAQIASNNSFCVQGEIYELNDDVYLGEGVDFCGGKIFLHTEGEALNQLLAMVDEANARYYAEINELQGKVERLLGIGYEPEDCSFGNIVNRLKIEVTR